MSIMVSRRNTDSDLRQLNYSCNAGPFDQSQLRQLGYDRLSALSLSFFDVFTTDR